MDADPPVPDPTTADEVLVALRTQAAALHPPAGLRDAVLRDLPDRGARAAAGRPPVRGRLALGLAAAAAVAAVVGLARWSGPDRAPPSRAPAGAPRDAAAVAAARARDVAAYARERERLRGLAGKWVVIAEPDPATTEGAVKAVVVGETLADVAKFAADAPHRFVFRVGDEGDVETFVSSWYAPRFAGGGIAAELGCKIVMHRAIDVEKDGRSARFAGATPFPAVAFHLAAPDGTPSPRNGDGTPEVFVGSLGPRLMLTPQDADELRLARWEVPGVERVGGVPCRRVLVTASVPAVGASGTVVGCVPDVPLAQLVAMARGRHAFWTWAEGLRDDLALEPFLASLAGPGAPPPKATWVVFGNNRVLGRGPTPMDALEAADRFPDVVYQRYVLQWPMDAGPAPQGTLLGVGPGRGDPVEVEVGGRRLAGSVPETVFYDSLDFTRPDHPGKGARLYVLTPLSEAAWADAGLARGELVVVPRLRGAPEGGPEGATVRAAVVRGRVHRGGAVEADGWVCLVAAVTP